MELHRWAGWCAVAAGLAFLAGCVQPLRLARDDSETVLGRQLLTAPHPAERGPFAVRTLFYGSGGDRHRAEYRDSVSIRTTPVDGSKLAAAPTPALRRERKKYWGFGFDSMPVNGRVWYPNGEGSFPLVLVVHGNHNMKDFSDPGYAYLGTMLASRGYIVVSVDMNFLNGNIRGENDARGWMLLKHLEAWRRFADSAGGPFQGKVDLTRIALMGHSRGGEAVVVAGLFNRLSHYPDDATLTFGFGFGIRSLVAIAPVDGQYEPVGQSTPLSNVNYLVVHGSHDGDVSSFSGLRQYERVRFTDGEEWFKAAVYMYRANHGQWNTVWGSHDAGPRSPRFLDLRGLIPAEEQRRFLEVYVGAFLDATLRDRAEYLPIFRDHRVIGGWLPRTMYITRFEESRFRALARYNEDVDVTTGAVPGVTLQGDSLATWREGRLPLRSRNGTVDHGAVWLGWNNRIAGDDTTRRGRPAGYRISLSDSLRIAWSIGGGSAVVLSLAPITLTPAPRKPAADSGTGRKERTTGRQPSPRDRAAGRDTLPVDLSIAAIDARGIEARVPLSRYGPVRRPLEMTVYRRRGLDKARFPTQHELMLQTYVIPLEDFVAVDTRFDPTQLRTIGLRFDRTEAGTVVLTDVGLSHPRPAFMSPEAP